MRVLIFFCLFCLMSCQNNSTSSQNTARLNLTKDPIFLDPRKARDLDSITLVRILFEGLTRTSKTGEVELALASTVEISDDGFQYVFHLRKSNWSNGDSLTAEDFVQTWKSVLNPQFATDIAYQLYPIKNAREAKLGLVGLDQVGIYAKDPETLVVELEAPLPYFLELISMTSFFPVHSKIVAANPNWALDPSSLVCNGPFQLALWEHSNRISFSKNRNYWESKEVQLDGIDFVVTSADTGLRMFEQKKLDWAGSPLSILPSDSLRSLKKQEQFQSDPFLATYFFRINTEEMIGKNKNPLSNPRWRRALASSLDREAIVDDILQGGQVAARTLVPPEMGLCSSVILDENLEKDWALKESKERIVVSYMNNERNASIVQVVQQQWEKNLGITVLLEAIEPKVFFQRISQKDFQVAVGSWSADFNDPINFLEVFKFKNEGTNNTGWENAEYIDLLNRSALCKSREERKNLLRKAEEILMEEMPIIPIFHYTLNYLKQKELQGVVLSPMGQLDLRWARLESMELR